MWKSVKLEDACQIGDGNHSSNYPKSSEMVGDGIPFLRAGNIQGGTVSDKDLKFLTSEKHEILKKGHLKRGDVLLTNRGEIGKTAIVPEKFDGANLNSQIAWLRPDERLLSAFLYYCLNTPSAIASLTSQRTGTALQQLTIRQIKNFEIPIPQLAEQQRIVAKLDAAFAEIDTAIEAAEDSTNNIDAIFEKILDASTQHIASTVKLKEVCDIQAKLISPKDEPYCNELHIGAGNIVSMSNQLVDVLSAKEEGLISSKFPFGTDNVLYSKIRPYLRKVHLPSHTGICSADMYPLIPDAKSLDRKYLYYLLLSQTFTDYAMSGSARAGMPKVNRNHLFDFEFQLPELEVQELVVKKMELVFVETANIKQIKSKKIMQIHALKSAILAQELQSEVA